MAIQATVDKAKRTLGQVQKAFDRLASSNGHSPSTGTAQRVLLIEVCDDRAWRCVAGEVGGEALTVSSAQTLIMGGEDEHTHDAELRRLAENAQVVLVSNSERSVCRILDLVDANPEQTSQMAALRLETELPYPVAESLWVCERKNGVISNGGKVLVVATPQADTQKLEAAIRAKGLRCDGIEYDAGAVSELLRATSGSGATVAVAWFKSNQIVLIVTQAGVPRYVRRIAAPVANATDTEWQARAANEVRQSLYDYWMRTNGPPPERLLVVGADAEHSELEKAFAARLDCPIEWGIRTGDLALPLLEAVPGELHPDYLACAGALISLHRRKRGEKAAVPPLRSADRASARLDLRNKRAIMILANVLLFAAVVAALFGVRTYRLYRADSVIADMKPVVSDLGRLQEEVDTLQAESRRQHSVADILLILSDAFPSDVTVETITLGSDGKMTIKGKTKSMASASEKAISSMAASGAFSKCVFLGATKEKEDFVFQISCELNKGQGKAKR